MLMRRARRRARGLSASPHDDRGPARAAPFGRSPDGPKLERMRVTGQTQSRLRPVVAVLGVLVAPLCGAPAVASATTGPSNYLPNSPYKVAPHIRSLYVGQYILASVARGARLSGGAMGIEAAPRATPATAASSRPTTPTRARRCGRTTPCRPMDRAGSRKGAGSLGVMCGCRRSLTPKRASCTPARATRTPTSTTASGPAATRG